MTRNWWQLTRIVVGREITERARAKSFWVASVLLLIAVAAGVIIPAVLHGTRSAARVGVYERAILRTGSRLRVRQVLRSPG